jgi:hypothetical protein
MKTIYMRRILYSHTPTDDEMLVDIKKQYKLVLKTTRKHFDDEKFRVRVTIETLEDK